jgi:small-conductance mechanosensitive channel
MNASNIFTYYAVVSNHTWAQLLVVVALYVLATIIIDLLANKVIRRICLHTDTCVDDYIVDIMHRPVYLTIFLVGIMHISSIVNFNQNITDIVFRICASFIALAWLTTLLKIVNFLADNLISLREKLGRDLLSLIHRTFFVVLIFLTITSWFWIWGIDLTPVFASAGVAGIAIALAARDTLANFFGGISLFLDKVYRVGDYVVIDNSERGEVVEVGIRSTRIITRDDVLVNIPNSIMATSKIINESAPYPQYRIKIPVGVAYGTDLDQVESILLDIAAGNKGIVTQPFPRFRVRALADSAVECELLVWVKDPRDRGLQIHLFLKEIHQRFRAENIQIPFPQMAIHTDA